MPSSSGWLKKGIKTAKLPFPFRLAQGYIFSFLVESNLSVFDEIFKGLVPLTQNDSSFSFKKKLTVRAVEELKEINSFCKRDSLLILQIPSSIPSSVRGRCHYQ